MSNVMTIEHPRWDEFTSRLGGPEGCHFRKDENGKGIWNCAGGVDKSFAIAILEDMGMNIQASLEYFEENGGYCDCEILFNVDYKKELTRNRDND